MDEDTKESIKRRREDRQRELVKEILAALKQHFSTIGPMSPETEAWLKDQAERKEAAYYKENDRVAQLDAERLKLGRADIDSLVKEREHLMRYRDQIAESAKIQAQAIADLAKAANRLAMRHG